MVFSLFWNVTQHRLVVTDVYGHPIVPMFKMGPIDCPETSLTVYAAQRRR